jgi:hypothetical protein
MTEVVITALAIAAYALLCLAAGKFIGLFSNDQRASDGEAESLGGEVQGAVVHIHSATPKEARHHV